MHTFPLLDLSRPLAIEEPLRHEDQGIERTDRDRETHPSHKNDDVAPACPLFRFLLISPVQILYQFPELCGTRYDPPAYVLVRLNEKEDDLIDAPEGLSCRAVEEEEETSKGSLVLWIICTLFHGLYVERSPVE